MKEVRVISKRELMELCVKNNLYTRGSELERKKMLCIADCFFNPTLDEILYLATDIVKHSDDLYGVFGFSTRDSIKCIASLILSDCCRSYIVD